MHAIGLIESNSIAKGIDFADIMVKTADVDILISKTICPGKYITMVSGDVAAVTQSVNAVMDTSPELVVDHFIIPNIHPLILPSITGGTVVDRVQAVGIIETFSVAATIEATDAAVKAASVTPIKMHLAFGIGGKSYVVLTGDVADVKASVEVGIEVATERGLLTNYTVIPRPHDQVIRTLI